MQSEVTSGNDVLCFGPMLPHVASKSLSPDPFTDDEQQDSAESAGGGGGDVMSPALFSFSAPMDNIVVRGYQFSIA